MKFFRLVFFCMLLSISSSGVYAQDSGSLAASAFTQAKYDDAAQLYDMAASLAGNSTLKTKYYDMARKSRECRNLTSRAATFYSSDNFAEARPLYSRILSLNPADKTAKSRLAAIDSFEANKKAAARLDQLYASVLKSVVFCKEAMDVTNLEDFIEKNPGYSRCALMQNMVAHLGSRDRLLSSDDVKFYVEAGKEFLAVGNTDVAAYLFDCAASFADLDGMYYKALTYDKGSNGYNTLVAIAAEGGHKEAEKLAEEIGYNTMTARNYYTNLKKHHSDFDAAFYVLLNRDNYYISELHPEKSIISQLSASADPDELFKYDDRVLYYLATSGDIGDRQLCEEILTAALLQGNADAIAEYAKSYAKEEYKDALYMFAWAGGAEQAVHKIEGRYKMLNTLELNTFLKVISGKNITDGEAYALYFETSFGSALDYHEGLYVSAMMGGTKSRYAYFKRFWKSARNKVYDKTFIERMRTELSQRPGEYYPKVLKALSKANARDGIYARNPVREVAELIPYESLHKNICPVPVPLFPIQ